MATAMYLEHYLDSIENLPNELQRNFHLMRDLDQRTEDLKAEIEGLASEYLNSVAVLSPTGRLDRLQRIQTAFARCREFGDDKVQLAMQTYEMVDKHIRRLDADLARFEAGAQGEAAGTHVLDMPVDPNEPTYCLCHQVSYGEMIGCDNPDCSIEWFHFACVGLTTKPKGKWYCPRCTQERKKK
uniref:Inhibitor of growth protein n=1 Tax=Eptatretus burgeri TaxID=7764 RepID=A0A8C4R4Y6_EPTBU